MENFTPEMIEKAKTAKNAEELLSLAKENNIEMTEEEAKTYFEQLTPKTGELLDEALKNVIGGVGIIPRETESSMQPNQAEVSFVGGIVVFQEGQATITNCSNTMKRAEVSEVSYAGGIVGYQDGQATITNCSNTGIIANN